MRDLIIQYAALITTSVAVILFIAKEIIEFFRLKNKRVRELNAIYFLLSQEINLNIIALNNLEQFCNFIERNKDKEKTLFDIHPPVDDDFEYCMANIGEAHIQIPLHAFHTLQYENLIYKLVELGSKHAIEVAELYADTYTIQKQQHKIIKLMKGELQGFLRTSTITILVGFMPQNSAILKSQLESLSKKIYLRKQNTP